MIRVTAWYVCMYVLYDANVGNRGYMNQEGSVYMFLSL